MSVKATELCKEDLSLHIDIGRRVSACPYETRDLQELPAQRGVRKYSRQRRIHVAEGLIRLNSAGAKIACSLHQLELVVQSSQLIKRHKTGSLFTARTRHIQLQNISQRRIGVSDCKLPRIHA